MKSREDVLRILAENKPAWQKRYPLRGIALSGSWPGGEQRQGSDVDIPVDVDPSIGLDFVSLAERIEDALGMPADAVSRRAIKPRHWKWIEPDVIHA